MRITTRIEQKLAHIGGPTVLLELGGLRLITDPTFDTAGPSYPTKNYTPRKSEKPAVSLDALGRIDVVLLNHELTGTDTNRNSLFSRSHLLSAPQVSYRPGEIAGLPLNVAEQPGFLPVLLAHSTSRTKLTRQQ